MYPFVKRVGYGAGKPAYGIYYLSTINLHVLAVKSWDTWAVSIVRRSIQIWMLSTPTWVFMLNAKSLSPEIQEPIIHIHTQSKVPRKSWRFWCGIARHYLHSLAGLWARASSLRYLSFFCAEAIECRPAFSSIQNGVSMRPQITWAWGSVKHQVLSINLKL